MDIVCVATFRSRPEAEFAKAMLEAEGIGAMVTADDAGGMAPHYLIGAGGARLHVRSTDAERARETLERAKSAELEEEA